MSESAAIATVGTATEHGTIGRLRVSATFAGAAGYLLADLIEGRSWILGRVIAALAWIASVGTITWGGRHILHKTRNK